MVTIGLFGDPGDQEVAALAERLRHRNADPWIIDLAKFPGTLPITQDGNGIRIDGRPIDDLDAAYLRRVGRNLPNHATYDTAVSKAEEEWQGLHDETLSSWSSERKNQAFRNSIVRAVARSKAVINPPDVQNLHRLKPFFLRSLAATVDVPQLAAGSDAKRLRAFAHGLQLTGQKAVDKPAAGIYKTELWSEERWSSHRWGSRPALYQRHIEGDTIRCYVLEGRLLTAATIVHGGTVDSSKSQTGIEPIELPAEAQALAVSVAESLGLAFCGLDLMRDRASGAHFVIDCNLSPMFVNFAKLSRCDIAGHLADCLIARGQAGAPRRFKVLDLVDEAKDLLSSDPEITRLLAKRRKDAP